MLRRPRRDDVPAISDLLARAIAEDEPLAGWNVDRLREIIAGLYRWDVRLLLGLFRLAGRPVARTIVAESRGEVAGVLALVVGRQSAHVGALAVEPTAARSQLKRELLEEGAREAARLGRANLLVSVPLPSGSRLAGDGSLPDGFRFVSETRRLRLEPTFPVSAGPAEEVRAFVPSDARAILELARRVRPPELESMGTLTRSEFALRSRVVDRFGSASAAFVVERGRGPEGFVRATVSRAARAGHLTSPIGAATLDGAGTPLLQQAIGWLADRGASSVLSEAALDPSGPLDRLRAFGFEETGSVGWYVRTLAGA